MKNMVGGAFLAFTGAMALPLLAFVILAWRAILVGGVVLAIALVAGAFLHRKPGRSGSLNLLR